MYVVESAFLAVEKVNEHLCSSLDGEVGGSRTVDSDTMRQGAQDAEGEGQLDSDHCLKEACLTLIRCSR